MGGAGPESDTLLENKEHPGSKRFPSQDRPWPASRGRPRLRACVPAAPWAQLSEPTGRTKPGAAHEAVTQAESSIPSATSADPLYARAARHFRSPRSNLDPVEAKFPAGAGRRGG